MGHVVRSHRWYKERQLETKWGGAVPQAVIDGVTIYDAALQRVANHDAELERKRREAELRAQMERPPRSVAPRFSRRFR